MVTVTTLKITIFNHMPMYVQPLAFPALYQTSHVVQGQCISRSLRRLASYWAEVGGLTFKSKSEYTAHAISRIQTRSSSASHVQKRSADEMENPG
jgi:hypothetical protein